MLKRFGYLFTLTMSVFGAALEWPEFRGPTGQGISTATNVPTQWGPESNVAWKTPTPTGWSSPIVSEGKIYLTGAIASETETALHALCLDYASGKILWAFEVLRPEMSDAKTKHSKNGLASPTPIVRDGKLYVHFGHLGTAALDLSGKVLWRQTSIKYPPVHGNGATPALANDLLIFSCDGAREPFLIALDAKNGEVKWKTPRNSTARNSFSFSTALLIKNDGANQVISPFSGAVAGYDPATGREIWRAAYGQGYSVISRPVFAHGLLFVSSGYDRPIIYAIDPKGAKGDATESAIKWSQAKGAPNTPSLLVVGDELYAVSDAGIASCLDAKTGRQHWSERLGGGFSASPVYAEGKIYFQNEEGIGYVVKASKQFELLAKNDLKERTLASPTTLDNAILIRSANTLWKFKSR